MNFIQTISKLDLRSFIFALLFLFTANAVAFSQDSGDFSLNQSPLGAPTSPVMDYAGVLDASVKSNLERKIIAFRNSTNPKVELAVAIVRTTGDRPIDMYSLAVARGWKIGSKEDDNPSALLFIAIDDRKYFTQVSRDLEDELPDGLAGQLQRQYLVPAFRQSNYSKGVNDTIDAYIRTITERQGGLVAPSPSPAERRQRNESSTSFCGFIICLIVIFIILSIIFGGRGRGGPRGGGGSNWRGGGFGGGGSGALPFIVGTILGNALSGGRGGSSDSGWGGSSGGDSWGGFGGGGDFGGGGAGGDW